MHRPVHASTLARPARGSGAGRHFVQQGTLSYTFEMTHQRTFTHSMTLMVVAMLFLAACGGDEEASVGTVPPVSEAPTTVAPTTSTTSTTTTTIAPDFVGDPEFDASSSVSTVGIDAVTFGMTIAQAEARRKHHHLHTSRCRRRRVSGDLRDRWHRRHDVPFRTGSSGRANTALRLN